MITQKTTRYGLALAVLLAAAVVQNNTALAQTPPPAPKEGATPAEDGGNGDGKAAVTATDIAAERLVSSAEDMILAKEYERAIRVLESVIERYPDTLARYKAHLVLGRHYVNTHKEQEGLLNLRHVQTLEKPDVKLEGDKLEMVLEATYLVGVAHYQTGQYGSATPVLRALTRKYPNTIWANQAYYYIGMCHFAQGFWQKAIDALGLVGTFVDPLSPSIQYMEAGRRLYCKIEDPDLPVLTKLGNETKFSVQAKSGDAETVTCIPLASGGDIFIGSIATEMGTPIKGDGNLQLVGGDTVEVTYLDMNTKEGKRNEPRKKTVKVVSTGSLKFTLGTFEAAAEVAFIGQPVFVVLQDADLDISPNADTQTIKLISRYRDLEAEAEARDSGGDIEKMMSGEGEIRKYKTRDEVTLTLKEMGEGPVVRSGRFGGKMDVIRATEGQPSSNGNRGLMAVMGDEIVAEYVDALHINGESPRQVDAKITVAGEIENRPMATQYVLSDPIVAAKKSTVEATAYLELARIFKSMGLRQGAAQRADIGLAQVDKIIRSTDEIPSSLAEEAFRLKWELEILKEDFDAAIATCQMFSKLFPESPLVDQALMGIGKIHIEHERYNEARKVFAEILKLPNSWSQAEAQFRLAQCAELEAVKLVKGSGRPPNLAAAIPLYKICAERYPDSEYAGESLGKMIDYYFESKDYAQAEDLLTRVFEDHPDAAFLDAMLLKWVMVAYRTGNYAKAQEKCTQLLFEYPDSPYAAKAKAAMPAIQQKIQAAAAPAAESSDDSEN